MINLSFFSLNEALDAEYKISFERFVPKLKRFLQIHYHDLEVWRRGESPAKRRHLDVEENHEKIAKFVHFASKLEERNRSKAGCTKAMAVRTLKKVTEIFEK